MSHKKGKTNWGGGLGGFGGVRNSIQWKYVLHRKSEDSGRAMNINKERKGETVIEMLEFVIRQWIPL